MFAFPHSEHLVVSREIRTVLDSGVSCHGPRIVLFLLQESTFRRQIAFVASRRVGNAIKRNRAKRLMREAYRHLRFRYPSTGLHLVLVARKRCGESTFQEVVAELKNVSMQMGLLVEAGSLESE